MKHGEDIHEPENFRAAFIDMLHKIVKSLSLDKRLGTKDTHILQFYQKHLPLIDASEYSTKPAYFTISLEQLVVFIGICSFQNKRAIFVAYGSWDEMDDIMLEWNKSLVLKGYTLPNEDKFGKHCEELDYPTTSDKFMKKMQEYT